MQKIERQSFTKNVLSLLEKSVMTVFRIWHSNPAFKKRVFKENILTGGCFEKGILQKERNTRKTLI